MRRAFTIALTAMLLALPLGGLASADHKASHSPPGQEKSEKGGPTVLPGPPPPDKEEGVQGNSPSAPDQDGKGPERNNPVDESDVDGNNGNGNDADRCDDDESARPCEVAASSPAPTGTSPAKPTPPAPPAPSAPVAPSEPGGSAVRGEALAVTGLDAVGLAAIAAALLGLGVFFLVVPRIRRRG
jgi:hypothetical protein